LIYSLKEKTLFLNLVNFKIWKIQLLRCRLQLVDCWLEKQKQPATSKQQMKRARARIEIIYRGDPVWSPENDNRQMAIDN